MEDKNYNFQKLTPNSDIDLKHYESAFEYIFNNSDLRNIAISGAYGSGKSSLIDSYKKKHKNLKLKRISLGHFKQSESEEESEIKESVLEGKIINQLIHQIPSDDIIQTNFKVKKNIKSWKSVITTFLTMLCLISILHMTMFERWNMYVVSLSTSRFKDILNISINRYSLILSGILVVIISSIFLYSLIKVQKTRNIFKKLSLQGNEIEIFEESEDSYFDKYLNEVLYLFENVNAEVIVFEDMDRFKATRIFEHLREINTLANLNREYDSKSPLRFFYLIRDDIFVSKDRTKFFDYIIPVVPVVDSSNSYDQFITHFKAGGINELFDNDFLQGLSLYIDDMRILKNIYNEFVIYYNRLNTTELDSNKMLAIIAYKNLFPRDFSELQLNQGMVYTLFAKKDEFFESEIKRKESIVSKMKKEIEFTKKEHSMSIEELNDIYAARNKRLANVSWEKRQRLEEEYTEEKSIREKSIENNLNNRLPILEEDLSRMEREITSLKSKQLNEIISRENIDDIFKVISTNEIGVESTFDDIKGSEYFALLKYLIRNGFIDETYADYMTYFYESSLSRIDKTFLRSITDRRAKEYTYKLNNPSLIINRLRLVDFAQEEILNFDLFQHLLKTKNMSNFLNIFLTHLKNTKDFKFIGQFFDTQREVSKFVKYLNVEWPEMLYNAIKESALTDKQIRLYSIYTFCFSDENNIRIMDKEKSLSNYISNCADYLDIDDPDIPKLIQGLRLLKISFVRIGNARLELLEAVYSNWLYEINFDNLKLMLKKFYLVNEDEEIHHKNYTLVLSKPDSHLADYVNENIDKYVDVILLNSNGKINDEESVALRILNNEIIKPDQKESYLELLKTLITSIVDVVDKDLWILLLKNNLVKYTEENIIEYFRYTESLDDNLISLINRDMSTLDFRRITNNDEEKVEKFFNASLVANGLFNNKYREILTTLDYKFNNSNIVGISEEKLCILIQDGILEMYLENLLFLREHYPNQVLCFIEKNVKEYVNTITHEEFEMDELLEILSWNVEDDIKIRLLDFTNDSITVLEKGYSTPVIKHILRNNFDSSDLSYLFITYEKWDDEMKQMIEKLAADFRDLTVDIASDKNNSNKLLKKLIESIDIEYNVKIDILISSLPNIDKETCKEYLDLLGLKKFTKLFEEGSRPQYEIDEANTKLLDAFKERNWILDFHDNKNKAGYYKVIRSK
ncbi:YobI family P-loop NTPase [Bacillus altitudinis]|uniref:YobI family P-loop NTPase n=1 Tax=Bacillus altitudinis TaxID=293387 RepID=UPI00345B372F